MKKQNKQNKTYLAIGIIAIILIAAIVIFSTPKSPKGEETIKVGAVLPLTGDFAAYGNDELDAINLLIEDYNSKAKTKIQLSVEDSKSDPKEALSAFNKLVLTKKPDVLLTLGSSISLALKPLINEQKIPTFSVAANPEVKGGYIIQNLLTSEDYVKKVVLKLNEKHINSVGVIYRNDDWGSSIKNSFRNNYQGTIFEEEVNPKETDFRTQITKIKNKNPEVLFLANTGKDMGLLIKQVRELMGNIEIYSIPEVNYEDVKETAGNLYYNITFSDLKLDWKSSKLKEFKEKYVNKYGRDPSFDSVLAYNEMIMISECIPFKENDSFLNCFTENKFEGLNGKLEIKNNKISYPTILKKI